MAVSEQRYLDGSYLATNPDWHVGDSVWKATKVREFMSDHGIRAGSICEVGCGAGEILRQLWLDDGAATFVGYEVSPYAYDLAMSRAAHRLDFRLADATTDPERFDLMLLLDVIEHVPDCTGFLSALRNKADYALMHVPLELCVQLVARPGRLARTRREVGHLHFFDADLAVATVADAGYEVLATSYTAGNIERPPQSLLSRAARGPRRALRSINEPLAARVLGGFSLLILAKPHAEASDTDS